MIEVKNVSKYYGVHAAVQNLNFQVAQGEVVGLLGLNGAGKTTTLRLLSGLVLPTTGQIYVGGLNMADAPEQVRGRIGFLPETPPLYPEMSVRGYLCFVARINGVRGDTAAALDAALGATDLLGVQHERIGTLSHGFRRRIGIAHTLVHGPHLILLDEPTNGLDPVQVVHMRRLIRALRGRHTVLVSSHLLGEIHALCDRILLLDEGRIAAEGTEEALSNRVMHTKRLALQVRGDKKALQKLLVAQEAVKSFHLQVAEEAPQAHGSGPTQGELLDVTAELARDARAELAAVLVQAGFSLLYLGQVHMALEGIFLELMGQQTLAAAPAGGRPAERTGDAP